MENSINKTSLYWLKRLEPAMQQLNISPLLGHSPSIDWQAVCQKLSKTLHIADLSITTTNTEWKASQSLLEGFGQNPFVLPIHITPLEGELHWVMSSRDIQKVAGWAFTKDHQSVALQTFTLQEGFYRYLALEALDAIFSNQPLTGLTPQLIAEGQRNEDILCFDIEIKTANDACVARLSMNQSFQKAWRSHFYKTGASYYNEQMGKNIELPMSLVVGDISMSYTQLNTVNPGDFIPLDYASYDPKSHHGTVSMCLSGEHLFQVLLKQNKLKLLDKHIHNKEQIPMENLPPEEALDTPEQTHVDDVDSTPANTKESAEGVNLKELPLNVTVEVARFSMSLDKLLKLEPGNTLELPVHPDQGVDLLVNGKKIGRAELVHLGEVLGVRVLEINTK